MQPHHQYRQPHRTDHTARERPKWGPGNPHPSVSALAAPAADGTVAYYRVRAGNARWLNYLTAWSGSWLSGSPHRGKGDLVASVAAQAGVSKASVHLARLLLYSVVTPPEGYRGRGLPPRSVRSHRAQRASSHCCQARTHLREVHLGN